MPTLHARVHDLEFAFQGSGFLLKLSFSILRFMEWFAEHEPHQQVLVLHRLPTLVVEVGRETHGGAAGGTELRHLCGARTGR